MSSIIIWSRGFKQMENRLATLRQFVLRRLGRNCWRAPIRPSPAFTVILNVVANNNNNNMTFMSDIDQRMDVC